VLSGSRLLRVSLSLGLARSQLAWASDCRAPFSAPMLATMSSTATTNLSMESLRKVREQTSALKDQYFPGFNAKIAAVPGIGHFIDATGRWLGISNVLLVVCVVVAATVVATRALGTATLCNIGGFAYPAYQTLLRVREDVDFEQWITYWMIFTALNVVEGNTYAFSWIPFWDGFKMGFLLFCSLPHTRGAAFIHRTWLAKLLKRTSSGSSSDGVTPASSSSSAPGESGRRTRATTASATRSTLAGPGRSAGVVNSIGTAPL
jgi:hypothetical protein